MSETPQREIRKEAQVLIGDTFTRDDLKLLLDDMGLSLDSIAPSSTTLPIVTLELVEWTVRRGMFEELVRAAAESRPKVIRWQQLLNRVCDPVMDQRNLVAQTAARWFDEVWNQRREANIDEFLTPEITFHSEVGSIRGPEDFRARFYRPVLEAFPDLKVTVEDVLASPDRAVIRWSALGTHQGGGLGIPASGRPVSLKGMTWVTIVGGKLGEGWQFSNLAEVLPSLLPGGPP